MCHCRRQWTSVCLKSDGIHWTHLRQQNLTKSKGRYSKVQCKPDNRRRTCLKQKGRRKSNLRRCRWPRILAGRCSAHKPGANNKVKHLTVNIAVSRSSLKIKTRQRSKYCHHLSIDPATYWVCAKVVTAPVYGHRFLGKISIGLSVNKIVLPMLPLPF